MKSIAQLVIWFFNPITTPLLALLLTLILPTDIDFNTIINSHYYLNGTAKKLIFNSFALFGWIFPSLSILLVRMTFSVASFDALSPRTRRFSLLLVGLYALMLLVVLFRFDRQMELPIHLFALVMAECILTCLFALLIIKTNICLHAGGIGILLGFMFAYYTDQALLVLWPPLLCCFVGGTVCACRLYLQKNSTPEIAWGLIGGFFITFVIDRILVIYGLPLY